MGRKRLVMALGVVGLLLGLAPEARGDTITVYSCKGPDGSPNPARGWQIGPTTSGGSGRWLVANGCGGGGTLSVASSGNTFRVGDNAYLRFTTAANTAIRRVALERATRDFGHRNTYARELMWYEAFAPQSLTLIDACHPGFSGGVCPGLEDNITRELSDYVTVPDDTTQIDIRGICETATVSDHCETGDVPVRLDVFSTRMVIEDLESPKVESLAGALAEPGTVAGGISATLRASDGGVGLRRAEVEVDDETVDASQRELGALVDTCQLPVGAPDTATYTTAAPCPASETTTLNLQTRDFPDGEHRVAALVADASGRETRSAPRTLTFDNFPAQVSSVSIEGVAAAGQRLGCAGNVSGQTPTTKYRWLRTASDGSNERTIAGAAGATYVLGGDDVGSKIVCEITASDRGGPGSARSPLAGGPFANGAVVTGPQTGSTGQTASGGASSSASAAPQAASIGKGSADIANPNDPAAIAGLRNPLAAGGDNGAPLDIDAVLGIRFERSSGTTGRVIAGFAQRVRIRGTITTNAGRPVSGARVYLAERGLDGEWRINGSTESDRDGELTLLTPARGRSRQLKVVYFPRGGSDANRASNPLSLVVRQDARLSLSPRRLHNGQRLRFRGSVLGTIPAAGSRVQVQVRLPTGWLTFKRLNVRRGSSSFQTSYRFRRTTSTTRYQFRVKVTPRSTTAYTVGYSPVRRVTVRP